MSILPCPTTIKELIDFEAPKTKRQLKSLLGVVNCLNKWVPGLSHKVAGIWQLNRGHAHFRWLPEHQQELEQLKQTAKSLIPVHPFQRGQDMFLYTDASVDGFGFVLMQRAEDSDKLYFVMAGSTGLKDSQKRYSTYEL